jgi:hypothetical protein
MRAGDRILFPAFFVSLTAKGRIMGTRPDDFRMVGTGGGFPAAFRLARAGLSVILTDPTGVMSGNCLAEGCVRRWFGKWFIIGADRPVSEHSELKENPVCIMRVLSSQR